MTQERYENGRPGYHDPLAHVGGAPEAISALTARLVLACFGLVVCAAGAVAVTVADAPAGYPITLAVLAVIAAVDIVVIIHRKRRGEPG